MKQAIVARTDIGMGQGKLAAQVAHASLQAYEDADATTRREWKGEGAKKIVLKGDSESGLQELADLARREVGVVQRAPRGGHRKVRRRLVVADDGPLADAGAVLDPAVVEAQFAFDFGAGAALVGNGVAGGEHCVWPVASIARCVFRDAYDDRMLFQSLAN